MLCIWRYETGSVYYELLKPARPCIDRKMTRMCRKKWQRDFVTRQCTISHSKLVKDTLKPLAWNIQPHLPYSLDLAPSDYHLFASMGHAFAEQHFSSFQEDESVVDQNLHVKVVWNLVGFRLSVVVLSLDNGSKLQAKILWTKFLELVINEYNLTPHSVTKFPPAYLLFGILPYTPPLAQNQVYPPVEEARRLEQKRTP
ncbi:mariner Mos1 transposase [Trichonephila clavipes]|nr:mariner Mos1 transposase [Trichonephila clavipes]